MFIIVVNFQKRRMNQDYYVFRDLVMSERTYLKDLESMRDVS